MTKSFTLSDLEITAMQDAKSGNVAHLDPLVPYEAEILSAVKSLVKRGFLAVDGTGKYRFYR
jgi:hypothetical protein